MHLYIIAWSPRGPSKVGIAEDPVIRLGELQTGNPYRLRIYGAIDLDGGKPALSLEAAFHKAFAPFAMVGEWVRLPPRLVVAHAIQMATAKRHKFTRWQPTAEAIANRQAMLERHQRKVVNARSAAAIEEASYFNVVSMRR